METLSSASPCFILSEPRNFLATRFSNREKDGTTKTEPCSGSGNCKQDTIEHSKEQVCGHNTSLSFLLHTADVSMVMVYHGLPPPPTHHSLLDISQKPFPVPQAIQIPWWKLQKTCPGYTGSFAYIVSQCKWPQLSSKALCCLIVLPPIKVLLPILFPCISCMCVQTCGCVHVVCMCVCLFVCVHACVCLHMYMCMCVYLCACVRI